MTPIEKRAIREAIELIESAAYFFEIKLRIPEDAAIADELKEQQKRLRKAEGWLRAVVKEHTDGR